MKLSKPILCSEQRMKDIEISESLSNHEKSISFDGDSPEFLKEQTTMQNSNSLPKPVLVLKQVVKNIDLEDSYDSEEDNQLPG